MFAHYKATARDRTASQGDYHQKSDSGLSRGERGAIRTGGRWLCGGPASESYSLQCVCEGAVMSWWWFQKWRCKSRHIDFPPLFSYLTFALTGQTQSSSKPRSGLGSLWARFPWHRQDGKASEETNDHCDQSKISHPVVLSSALVGFPLLRQNAEDKQLGKIGEDSGSWFSLWLLCPVAIDMFKVEHIAQGKPYHLLGAKKQKEKKSMKAEGWNIPLRAQLRWLASSI